jgi:hypothetical protein
VRAHFMAGAAAAAAAAMPASLRCTAARRSYERFTAFAYPSRGLHPRAPRASGPSLRNFLPCVFSAQRFFNLRYWVLQDGKAREADKRAGAGRRAQGAGARAVFQNHTRMSVSYVS